MTFSTSSPPGGKSHDYPLFDRDSGPASDGDADENAAGATHETLWDETALETMLAHPEKDEAIYPAASDNLLTDYATRIWRWFKYLACVLAGCWLIGWPLGDLLSYRARYGSVSGWQLVDSYEVNALIYAVIIPILVLLIGYVLAIGLRMSRAADRVSRTAEAMMFTENSLTHGNQDQEPPLPYVPSASVHEFKIFIDNALDRLAGMERHILEQISTIELATRHLAQSKANTGNRIADERDALVQLTDEMNIEADHFAEAVARKVQLATQTRHEIDIDLENMSAEKDLQHQLARIEAVSDKALLQLETLKAALTGGPVVAAPAMTVSTAPQTEYALRKNTHAILEARRALESESARLETLINAQRERADRLAEILMTKQGFIAQSGVTAIDESSACTVPEPHHMTNDPIARVKGALQDTACQPAGQPSPEPPDLAERSDPDLSRPGHPEETLSAAQELRMVKRPETFSDHQRQSSVSQGYNRASENRIYNGMYQESGLPDADSLSDDRAVLPTPPPRREAIMKMRFIDGSLKRRPSSDRPADKAGQVSASSGSHTRDLVALLSADAPHAYHAERQTLAEKLYQLSLNIYIELYGIPTSHMLQRYEAGERHVFANEIVSEDERAVKERFLTGEMNGGASEALLRTFLGKFDALLETATDRDFVEKDLDDLIATPLGRLYVLIGTCGITM